MSVQMFSVRSASDAWKLLRGLVCVHKPSDGSIGSLVNNLKRRLVCDLNEMKRSVECNSLHHLHQTSSKDENGITNHPCDVDKYESGYEGIVSPDYATHPLVLGKGNL